MAQSFDSLQQHAPDWPAAAVAGLAAGAILMVLDLFWSTAVMGTGPWITSRRIAAIFMGADTLKASDFSVGTVALAWPALARIGPLHTLHPDERELPAPASAREVTGG